MLKSIVLAMGIVVGLSSAASAHFQLVFTDEVNPARAGELPVQLIFWHPWSAGYAMDMEPPEKLEVIHRGGVTDLTDTLRAAPFRGHENEAISYRFDLPVKRSGDYVIALVPAPYFEESEDIYIQQFTKSFVSRLGVPTDWMNEVGHVAEILPLNRPTNIIVGSTFSGRVLSNGNPVAGAVIEVEYIAAEPNVETGGVGAPTVGEMIGGAIVVISDSNGEFTFGIPRSGFWGFAALGVGPVEVHMGKPLSQDAVIWIRAYGME